MLVVQATTGSNHASRRTKLDGEGFTALWEGVGAQLEVWSWTKQGPRGQGKGRCGGRCGRCMLSRP